ncbi:MAG: 2-C-methyl-D-erythritol 4-phosphate cytidylyltransferase [Planctomycetota bacterium]
MEIDPQLWTSAVIVAAGQSTRMARADDDARARKPFLVLEGRTVLEHACAAFDAVEAVREIVVVGHPEDLERIARMAAVSSSMRKVKHFVAGGELRVDSVRAGVAATSSHAALLAIHDAARPLVRPETIRSALITAAERGAALVAIPVADTIKTSPDGTCAERTLHRSVLWSAQTPQVFRARTFRELLSRAQVEGLRPTDDSAIYETYVGPVPLVAGDAHNLKITTPEDLVIAAAILHARAAGSVRT